MYIYIYIYIYIYVCICIHVTCLYIYNIPIICMQVGKQLCKSNLEPHWALRDRAARLLTFICHRYSAPYSTLQQRITTTLMHAFLVWMCACVFVCVRVYVCVCAHLHLPSRLCTLLKRITSILTYAFLLWMSMYLWGGYD